MAELTPQERETLDDSDFGLPERRAYPMRDASHAHNAKARAVEELKAGKLSAWDKERIDRKADQLIARLHEDLA